MPPMSFSILQIAGSRARKALEGWCSLDYDLLACWERTLLLPVTVKASGSISEMESGETWGGASDGAKGATASEVSSPVGSGVSFSFSFFFSFLFFLFFSIEKNVLVENRDRRANSLNLVNSPAE